MFNDRDFSEAKSKDEILQIISQDEFKNIFTSKGIKNIIVFGSLSKGNFNIESDVDIAIVRETKLSLNEELNICSNLEDLFGRSVDLIDISDDSISNVIKIEALNSNFIVMHTDLLDKVKYDFEILCRENEDFWFFLDRKVLDNE